MATVTITFTDAPDGTISNEIDFNEDASIAGTPLTPAEILGKTVFELMDEFPELFGLEGSCCGCCCEEAEEVAP